LVEDLKKGQIEVNILDQKNRCYLEAEESHQILKINRLKKNRQTWKTLRLRRSWGTQNSRQICHLLLLSLYLRF